MNIIRKHLENLYSWYEFYKINQNHIKKEIVEKQIKEYKQKYNLK